MQTIIFVHGFGVKKDARGMFTEIVDFLTDNRPDLKCVLVDLNTVDETNDIRVNPLSVQSKILEDVYNGELKNGSEIALICHSQGCVVVSIANLLQPKKIILLAPPTNNDIQKTIQAFSERPGTVINREGESFFMRKDGSRTIVPREYWSDREHIDYEKEYALLEDKTRLHVIVANQDEVVSNENVGKIFSGAKVIFIDGNHNFEGDYRAGLLKQIGVVFKE